MALRNWHRASIIEFTLLKILHLRMRRLLTIFGLASVILLAAFAVRSGGDEPVLPDTPYNYADIGLPPHLSTPGIEEADNTPSNNAITDAGATLGRVLFYDRRLSANETVSCGSCHFAENGFSDPRQFSIGFEGGATPRNSMGLSFTRYYLTGKYFWDERAASLEAQTLMPIQDPVEMGMTLPAVLDRLEATTFYPGLFADAFGTQEITSDRISLALSQFLRSMVAPNSRYDQGRAAQGGPAGVPVPGLTTQENEGLQIFFGEGRCNQCHEGDLQIIDFPRNNGLDPITTDPGVGDGRFKVTSLRNVELTAPYMHDGRFETLEDVVEFYNSGIQPHPALDRILIDAGQPVRFNFSEDQRAALVAFLRTLTDDSITDVRWSDPFDIVTDSEPTEAPDLVALRAAFPNPFRTQTALRFELTEVANVKVTVYDLAGRLIATLSDGSRAAGFHEVLWDVHAIPGGVYVVRLEADGRPYIRMLTVLR